ncbi:hypothetical protein CKF54_05915 [Psittacicella hinzii]|uniref:Uncharacterized protein n=1 Tax=Psittacicella hinzii TaxID=2028575 RepID=A0A3A1Y6Y3_9GAMM|nr:hypothetical protein [Psittacicella hinzii]RIY31877.1 hypothetical protein CKF54_05915 [Psittacicella hinzii]
MLANYSNSSFAHFTEVILSKPIEVLIEETYYGADDPKSTHADNLLTVICFCCFSAQYYESSIPEHQEALDLAENLITNSITSEEGKRVWQEKQEYVANAYNSLFNAAEEFMDVIKIAYGPGTLGEELFVDVQSFSHLVNLIGSSITLGFLDKETIQEIEQSMK